MTVGTLAPLETAARIGRLRVALADAGIAALLVTELVNVRYLTGFTGSAGTVLVTADDACFVTDGRYTERAHDEIGATGAPVRVEIAPTVAAQREILREAAAGAVVALEDQSVTWAQQRELAEVFVAVLPAGAPVQALRRVKDAGEVDRIRAACAIADDALGELLPTLAERPTEREFALRLEFGMRERGASAVSFDPIVASGPNGALPHARPSGRQIGRAHV